MVQICVWFDRPLEKTRFVSKCKGECDLFHRGKSCPFPMVSFQSSFLVFSQKQVGVDELRLSPVMSAWVTWITVGRVAVPWVGGLGEQLRTLSPSSGPNFSSHVGLILASASR